MNEQVCDLVRGKEDMYSTVEANIDLHDTRR